MTDERSAAKSVRAVASGIRTAILLQIGLAILIAVFSAAAFALIRDQRQMLEQRRAEIDGFAVVTQKWSDGLVVLSQGTQLPGRGRPQAIESLKSAAQKAHEASLDRTVDGHLVFSGYFSLLNQIVELELEESKYKEAAVQADVILKNPNASTDDRGRALGYLMRADCATNQRDKAISQLKTHWSDIQSTKTFDLDNVGKACGFNLAGFGAETGLNTATLDQILPNVSGYVSEYKIRDIWLQINNEQDRDAAALVGSYLCRAGYNVSGIEKVNAKTYPSRGGVRYYYPLQAREAADVKAMINKFTTAPDQSGGKPIPSEWRAEQTVTLVAYDGFRKDRLEVWFAPTRAPEAPQVSDHIRSNWVCKAGSVASSK